MMHGHTNIKHQIRRQSQSFIRPGELRAGFVHPWSVPHADGPPEGDGICIENCHGESWEMPWKTAQAM